MKIRAKYNLLAVLIFWIPTIFLFGFFNVLFHFIFISCAVLWAFVSIAASTWIGDRTFNRWNND